MATSGLLFFTFFFAVTFCVYIIFAIFRGTERPEKQRPAVQYFIPVPVQEQQSRKGDRGLIWPMVMVLFVSSVLYLLYHYDGQLPDLTRDIAYERNSNVSRSANFDSPYIYKVAEEEHLSISPETVEEMLLSVKASKQVGAIVASQAHRILAPLNRSEGWGIKLVCKEQALRWMEDFEDQMAPYTHNGRQLMMGTVYNPEGVPLQSFYLAPFKDKQTAQSLLRSVRYILPDAHLVLLENITGLEPFVKKASA
jgi:hypothetical protein